MNGQEAQTNWFDALIKKLHLDKLNITSSRLIEIGMYLALGFVAGFLLKRCANYVFIVILTFVGLLVLHQFGVLNITIDPTKMQEIFGIKQTLTVNASLMSVCWEWIKLNLAVVVSFGIGLFIGLKLG